MEFQTVAFSVDNNVNLKGIKMTGANIAQRNPTHTIILLDVSGSMNGDNKLKIVKKSLYFLLHFFQSTDSLSLVTFNSYSDIIINNKFATQENLQIFNHTIDRLEANAGTNLSAGLLNVKSILETANNQAKTGLIILTDGHTNEGVVTNPELIRIIQSIRGVQQNISITSIGYGHDHNAILLKDIATEGNGSYNIVNNIEEVATVFGDILGGLISCVVQNVIVTYPRDWKCLNHYPKTIDLTDNSKIVMNIGDIYAESETVLIFENSDSSVVKIQGTQISNLTTIIKDITWGVSFESIGLAPYLISYIRLKVAQCLIMIDSSNSRAEVQQIIQLLKTYIEAPYIQNYPLTTLLRNEIHSIESQLSSNYVIDELNSSQNIQHSAFLGLSRGVSSTRPNRHVNINTNMNMIRGLTITDDDEDENMNNVNNTPYANNTQRMISQTMVQYSQQDPSDTT